MEKHEVRLYPRACRDIDDIYEYISFQKLSPETAKRQTDRIWDALSTLETFPEEHQDRLVGKYAGKGYKQLIVDNYLVIYRIQQGTGTVFVVTVQYQGRNI